MTDDELKQLVDSNAKSIQALTDSLAAEGQERQKAYREWEKDRNQLYKYLGRIAAAQSNFYEVQADYYHQIAALSERQINVEETLAAMQAQILQILERLSLPTPPESEEHSP